MSHPSLEPLHPLHASYRSVTRHLKFRKQNVTVFDDNEGKQGKPTGNETYKYLINENLRPTMDLPGDT